MGKKKKKKNKGNQNVQVEKKKHFNSTEEMIGWIIGMIFAYFITIYTAIWSYMNNERLGLAAAISFILVLTAFLVSFVSVDLFELYIGIALILMGLVIPILLSQPILAVLLFILWGSGFLLVVNSIAKITKTKDKKYYKVINNAANKIADRISRRMFDNIKKRNNK